MVGQIILTIGKHSIARAVCKSANEWTITNHLAGLAPASLTTDPRRPTVVYAGTNGSGVYRSADSGASWASIGLLGQNIKSMAVSPLDEQTLYAGVKPAGVWKSIDGGQSWKELDGFRRIPNRWWWFSPAEMPFKPYVMALSVSPTDPNLVMAGIELGAVVRSEDGGQTWSGHRRGAMRDYHDLKFHFDNGSWVYQAGGSGGGAAMSQNGGQTWQQLRAGLAKHYGVACAADPSDPEIWYIAIGSSPWNAFGDSPQAYLYRTSGGGVIQPIGWEPLPMGEMPTALATDPSAPGHLYAGTLHGAVYHSADYGDQWRKLPFEFESIWMSLIAM